MANPIGLVWAQEDGGSRMPCFTIAAYRSQKVISQHASKPVTFTASTSRPLLTWLRGEKTWGIETKPGQVDHRIRPPHYIADAETRRLTFNSGLRYDKWIDEVGFNLNAGFLATPTMRFDGYVFRVYLPRPWLPSSEPLASDVSPFKLKGTFNLQAIR